jgi:hypothetical protein
MSKLNIIYNIEFDIQRVIDTIKKIDWYIEKGYNLKNLSFPKIFDIEKIKEYSEEEIKNAVINEYSDDLYKDNEKFLVENWEKASKEIELAFSKSKLLCQSEYKIFLTKYGMGGSYNLPNVVIINLSNSFMVGMLRTIIHEIIHLAIEESIVNYKIGQAQKERIVDLFFIKNFSRRIFMQKVYSSIDTEKIDQTFDDNFPNIETIIKKLSQ